MFGLEGAGASDGGRWGWVCLLLGIFQKHHLLAVMQAICIFMCVYTHVRKSDRVPFMPISSFLLLLKLPTNIYFLLISELQTLTGDWLGSLCRMNNVTHNLHLNGQTTVAWKTLLYVLVGICFFGCLSIALCSFHTIYLYVGFKCFWFYSNKSTGRVRHVCVNSQMLDLFLVSSSPRPPCPANELGHDSQPPL